MVSGIILFVAILVPLFIIMDKQRKKGKDKIVTRLEGVIAAWIVIGVFLLNMVIIGQGVAEIEDGDKYIRISEDIGVHQTEDGRYYQIKSNPWTFWNMYDREYITNEQFEILKDKYQK